MCALRKGLRLLLVAGSLAVLFGFGTVASTGSGLGVQAAYAAAVPEVCHHLRQPGIAIYAQSQDTPYDPWSGDQDCRNFDYSDDIGNGTAIHYLGYPQYGRVSAVNPFASGYLEDESGKRAYFQIGRQITFSPPFPAWRAIIYLYS